MSDDAGRAFVYTAKENPNSPNLMKREALEIAREEIKNGPKVWKSAQLDTIGNRETGPKRLVLSVRERRELYDENGRQVPPSKRWWCEGEEVERLRAFLNREFDTSGRYIRIDGKSLSAAVRQISAEGELPVSMLAEILELLVASPDLTDALIESGAAAVLAGHLEREKRKAVLKKLRDAVEDPASLEHVMQKILQENPWIFGGQYVGMFARRRLTIFNEIDIPLIRADNSIHIVELKRAKISKLLFEPRDHPVAGPEIHEAVTQVMTYLCALDEQRAHLKTELEIDTRRTTATVVIGHPMFCGYSAKEVDEALRVYSATLNRIQVITYLDLLESAERAFEIGAASLDFARRDAGQDEGQGEESDHLTDVPSPRVKVLDDPWAVPASDPWAKVAPPSASPFSFSDEPPF